MKKKIGMFAFLGLALCLTLLYAVQPSKNTTVQSTPVSTEVASAQPEVSVEQPSVPNVQPDKPKKAGPTICLNMIIKDETPVIRRCLQSVKHLLDYWVIVDTGSTDGTQQMVKEFMADIPGELHEKPWKNFEHNRNEALQLAKGKGDYLLFIDADEVLEFASDFVLPPLDKDVYMVTTHYGGMKYGRIQLVNNHIHWDWIGVLHEVLVSNEEKSRDTLTGVYNVPRPDGNRSQDPKKYYKDAAILEAALKENPNHARNTFYLAQSWRDAGEHEKSLEVYEKRVALGGWDQEVFWSLYQIATLKEALKRPADEVIAAYKFAYAVRPTRAEPLYRLALYYRSLERYAEAYETANKALTLKKSDDVLFVEDWMYEYGVLLEYAVAGYWTEHYVEALLATKLLLSKPNLPSNYTECCTSNLWWINTKLDEQPKRF